MNFSLRTTGCRRAAFLRRDLPQAWEIFLATRIGLLIAVIQTLVYPNAYSEPLMWGAILTAAAHTRPRSVLCRLLAQSTRPETAPPKPPSARSEPTLTTHSARDCSGMGIFPALCGLHHVRDTVVRAQFGRFTFGAVGSRVAQRVLSCCEPSQTRLASMRMPRQPGERVTVLGVAICRKNWDSTSSCRLPSTLR